MPSSRSFTVGAGAASTVGQCLHLGRESRRHDRHVATEPKGQKIALRPPAVHLDGPAEDLDARSVLASRSSAAKAAAVSFGSKREVMVAGESGFSGGVRRRRATAGIVHSCREWCRLLLTELAVDLGDDAQLHRVGRGVDLAMRHCGAGLGSEPSKVARMMAARGIASSATR